MNLSEKVSYLKGLMDGLSVDDEQPEGRLFKAIIETLEEMADCVSNLEEDMDEVIELADNLDEDLGTLEEYIFGEDDEDFDEESCPCCGHELELDYEETEDDEEPDA